MDTDGLAAIAAATAGATGSGLSTSQTLAMRSRSAPIISRSWRSRNRLLSHSLSQPAGATTISSHWPLSVVSGTEWPSMS